jgi:hypothetical protein
MQQCKNPSPKHKKPKHLYNKTKLQNKSHAMKVWMWCTIQYIFMLCVMSVVTTMVIGANIGTHDKIILNLIIFVMLIWKLKSDYHAHHPIKCFPMVWKVLQGALGFKRVKVCGPKQNKHLPYYKMHNGKESSN